MSDFLAEDAAFFLEDFGEDVVILDTPNAAPRTIKAIIERHPPTIGRDGKKLDALMLMEAMNDPVKGVASAVLELGMTRAIVAERLGVTPNPKGFGIVLPDDGGDWMDAGMLTLGLK